MKFFTSARSHFSTLLLLVVFLGLQGCSGGSSTPIPNANPTGHYTGSAAVKQNDNTTNLAITDIQIMVNNGRLMMMSDAQAVLYNGTMSINGNSFTTTVDVYKNGTKQTGTAGTATINGTITQGSQLTGNITGTGLGNGSFVSTYSTLNNTASTSASIDSTVTGRNTAWNCNLNEFIDPWTHDIDNTGSVVTAGVPSSGVFDSCQIVGTISPIATTGLFSVNLTAVNDNCNDLDVESSASGAYSGFAILKRGASLAQDILSITMSNGKYSTGDDCTL